MDAITILPTHQPEESYEAAQGTLSARGRTAGEALDALTALLEPETATHVVVVQAQRPDRFFGATERARLEALMRRFHDAQASGEPLGEAEQAELERLIDAELDASEERARALTDALR